MAKWIQIAGGAPRVATCATPAVNTVPFSATPTFDLSLGGVQNIVLTGNVTSITITNGVAGATYTFLIIQDSSGGHTFAWGSAVKGGMEIGDTLSTASLQSFIYDGTYFYATGTGAIDL